MFAKIYHNAREKAVGPELAAFLPVSTTPWYKKSELLYLNFCLISLFLLSSSNGYDGSMMNGLQALPQWQKFMGSPKGAWLGFISGAQVLGGSFMLPGIAWMSNRFGRKPTIALGYLWLFLGAGLQTASRSHGEFIVGRVIVGLATSHFAGCVPLLMTETAYPTHRGIMTCLFMCGWFVGSFLAAWATYGTRNYDSDWAWRIPSLLQIAIPIAAAPGLLMCPESPRWYASRDRINEARAFLVKYHAGGDEKSPLAEFELAEITRSMTLEREAKKSTSWLDMLRTRGNRWRTFITIFLGIFDQWAGQNIASYYLAPVLITVGVTSVTNQTMISGFLQLWNLFWALTGSFCVDLVGRRFLFLSSCAGMLASYIVITALSATFATSGSPSVGIAVIPFLFIMYAFFAIAFTPLFVAYPVEIWTFQLRSRGLSLGLISTYFAVFFNIFVNPIALEAIAWKYYLVFCMVLAVGGIVIYFTFPETRGHSLEEMARIFDGEDAAVPGENKITEEVIEYATPENIATINPVKRRSSLWDEEERETEEDQRADQGSCDGCVNE